MDAIEALRSRRSVRAFTATPVDRTTLQIIVDCARLAPTAINIQPWEFVVVTDAAARKHIAATVDHGPFIADAPACIVVLCKDTKYYLEDGCAATVNILNAAHALGLGGCWVAGDKKTYVDAIREIVGAPADYNIVSLIAIGHPAATPNPDKRPLELVLHWDRF
ncbi:MAG TPA: nitroreductase family protein [Candidatus Hydrogenedentes bacterium]|nr:nitroreductase family protein [Candidatus Hydrogenedentota bacterium]HOS02914.1 nitroreductase family protein [Candidatus Hydrogenedentota bacterium]